MAITSSDKKMQIQFTEKILIQLTPNDGGDIVPLINAAPYQKLGYTVLAESLEIKNLKFISFITSLPAVPFPVFPLEASETETQLEIFNLEWNSPRIILELLTKYISDSEWQQIGLYSMLNVFPLPYREFNFPTYNLGDNTTIAVKTIDVGHGNLTANDKVQIQGDLHRTIYLEKISNGAIIDGNLIANTAKQVLAENLNRTGFTVFNNGTVDVFLDVLPTVSSTQFLVRIPAKSFYESSFSFTDNVYLFSTQNSVVNIREF